MQDTGPPSLVEDEFEDDSLETRMTKAVGLV
jgi:hypothetical protein